MFGLLTLTVLIIVSIIGFIINRVQKRRMRNALGREVHDRELTSINSWIAVSEAEDRRQQK